MKKRMKEQRKNLKKKMNRNLRNYGQIWGRRTCNLIGQLTRKIRKLHRKGIYQHLQRKTTISKRRKFKFKTNREDQELNNYNWDLVAKELRVFGILRLD